MYLQRGRYFLEEISPEFQGEFEKIIEDKSSHGFNTIKFLNPADIEKYIKPEYLHKSIDERRKHNIRVREIL